MNNNPLKQGALTQNAKGLGTVTPAMVRTRAAELALIGGRSSRDISQTDWYEAKRELTGTSTMSPKQAYLEAAAESERWDPLPGSAGHQSADTGAEDQDDEGRSDSARLVEEGVAEAVHDQMLQAAENQQRDDDKEAGEEART
jgi:hypothetical protein